LIEAPSAVVDNLVELKVAARELRGGLVHDPYTDPTGAGRAWAFVREDLGLRVVAERAAGERRLRLVFSDPLLRLPEIVDLATGEVRPATGVRRASDFVVVVDEAPDVVLIRLHRPSAAELEGFDEEIEVGGGRQMPVEEILRRLQAFKDDQDRGNRVPSKPHTPVSSSSATGPLTGSGPSSISVGSSGARERCPRCR